VSTVDDIVAILGELSLLRRRDPEAMARREQILAAKHELLDRIRAEDDSAVIRSPRQGDDDATARRR